MVTQAKMQVSASWSTAKGPMAVVWPSLKRIGWDLSSATGLVSDLGHAFDMLTMPPQRPGRDRQAMHRKVAGQTHHIAPPAHLYRQRGHMDEGCEDVFAGARRALWSDSIWSRAKLLETRYGLNPGCV